MSIFKTAHGQVNTTTTTINGDGNFTEKSKVEVEQLISSTNTATKGNDTSTTNDNNDAEDETTVEKLQDVSPFDAPPPPFSNIVPDKVQIENKNDKEFVYFEHFIAQNSTMKCWSDDHITPFNLQVRGACLGGWLVLEPWITPSLFYQFLGKSENSAAMDMYSFCNVLGPEEGNKQLHRHWKTWLTEEHIKILAEEGNINSVRLPVGDWMYKPYGPYIGCTDGALDYVDNVLDWAYKYNITVLIDIHGHKDSQNGLDNSGQSLGFEWTSILNTEPKGLVTFEHWPIRTANWIGTFDRNSANYTNINYDNIAHSLEVIYIVVQKYKNHPAVLGLEPINEPWQYTPIDILKRFYWEGYLITKKYSPHWKYVMHDSFRLDTSIWGGFMSGCPDRALDTHIYQAWNFPASRETFYNDACSQKHTIAAMEDAFGPVIVGEWSLATDNCAMWLNGFNDNLSGYPMRPCKYVECPKPYMGPDQPGTPVDPGKPIQGPFGTGMSGPSWGMCPVDRDWIVEETESGGLGFRHSPPEAPTPDLDDTKKVMTQLAYKKINAFSGIGHGYYFWNFRTELPETQWNYIEAVRQGWIPGASNSTNIDEHALRHEIASACDKEDKGRYKCVAKRGMLDKNILSGLGYCLSADTDIINSNNENNDNKTLVHDISYYANLTGNDLADASDAVFDAYWSKHRLDGATCDFGGIAQLRELNYTYVAPSDDDNDDFFSSYSKHNKHRTKTFWFVLVSCIVGFLAIFGTVMMGVGGRLREKTLRGAGAIRRSYARLGDAIKSASYGEELHSAYTNDDKEVQV